MASSVRQGFKTPSGTTLLGGRTALIAGGGVSVRNIADGRIFQRVGTTKDIPVLVDFTGTPSLIEVRVVDFNNSAIVISDWAPLAVNPATSPASGTVNVPQTPRTQWGRLQTRDGANKSLTSNGTTKFAVGLLVSLIGQSNTVNLWAANSGVYPLAHLGNRRYVKSTDTWNLHGNYDATGTYPANTPVSTYGATRTDNVPRGDGIVYFTNYLSAALDLHVGTLEYAVIGSNILTNWNPNGNGSNNLSWVDYRAALIASGGDCEYVYWGQGEENANTNTSSTAWQGGLSVILSAIKAITGRTSSTMKLFVGTLGTITTYANEGNVGVIRTAQAAFVAANAGCYLTGAVIDLPIGDSVHRTATSLGIEGKRLAKVLAAGGTGNSGPKITSASRNNLTVTANISHIGTIADGAGGTGAGLLGFRLFDGASVAPFTMVGIVGDTVQMTLSGPPSGALTLDFGMANSPFGTTTPLASTALYDNDIVPGHTLGMTLQPRSAIPVT